MAGRMMGTCTAFPELDPIRLKFPRTKDEIRFSLGNLADPIAR